MKRGFTLIELLAVVVIIGVIALIAVPAVMTNISDSKEQLYIIQVQNIELAAKKWATDNYAELDSDYINPSFVPVDMLRNLEYLTTENIKNPKEGSYMDGCVKVTYLTASKNYSYVYDDANNDCNSKTVPGYYYEKENDKWKLIKNHQLESVSSYLTGENGSNIVVTGAGLYDMGDRYVFRGSSVNNYVKIESKYYRILSIDKTTKAIKLIKVESNGSAVWDADGKADFNVATIHTDILNKSLYPGIVDRNMRWNIGTLDTTDSINIEAIRAYEAKTKIDLELGMISMSEYMEASSDSSCSSGNYSACANENYLSMADAWTITTVNNQVAYINADKGISFETDLINAHHYLYYVMYVNPSSKTGSGTYVDPFLINI